MMSYYDIAENAKVSQYDIKSLLDGDITQEVAERFTLTRSDLQQFIREESPYELGHLLGIAPSELLTLRREFGKQGAVGLILGLLLTAQVDGS
ncbi:hypothetical protein [Pleionea sp. CnH1-48]|uniref:hypothetical protein n=1 Tax=Pleionea sp. CnH1-48 TaxID=2954494 RepID=UPI002097B585|nr:hypothetical protein [Pleionea sp. CnH1-48]MCO7223055.1 hypothetical protein [Pleionea sp. CnH1-48]